MVYKLSLINVMKEVTRANTLGKPNSQPNMDPNEVTPIYNKLENCIMQNK